MSTETNYTRARKITPGTPVIPGDGVVMSVSAEGKIGLIMQSGSVMAVYMYVGTSTLDDYAVIGVDPATTTATADVYVVD